MILQAAMGAGILMIIAILGIPLFAVLIISDLKQLKEYKIANRKIYRRLIFLDIPLSTIILLYCIYAIVFSLLSSEFM
jgi:hypothetical protein